MDTFLELFGLPCLIALTPSLTAFAKGYSWSAIGLMILGPLCVVVLPFAIVFATAYELGPLASLVVGAIFIWSAAVLYALTLFCLVASAPPVRKTGASALGAGA